MTVIIITKYNIKQSDAGACRKKEDPPLRPLSEYIENSVEDAGGQV